MNTGYKNWLKNMILIVTLFLMETVGVAQEINKSFIRDSVDGNLFIMKLSDKENVRLAYDYGNQEIYGLKDNYLVRLKIGSDEKAYDFEIGKAPIKNLPVIKNSYITFDTDDMWIKSSDGKVYKVNVDSDTLTGEAKLVKEITDKNSGAWGYSQDIKTGEERVYSIVGNIVKYQTIKENTLSDSKELFKMTRKLKNINVLFVKNGYLFFKKEKEGIIYKIALLSEEQSAIPLMVEIGEKSIYELRKELELDIDLLGENAKIDGGETATENRIGVGSRIGAQRLLEVDLLEDGPIVIKRSVDKNFALRGEVLTYRTTTTNIGNATKNHISIESIFNQEFLDSFEEFTVYEIRDDGVKELVCEVNQNISQCDFEKNKLKIKNEVQLHSKKPKEYITSGRIKSDFQGDVIKANSVARDSSGTNLALSNEVVTTIGETEYDYGDAPQGGKYNYKTIVSSPARHRKTSNSVRFGERLDYEGDAAYVASYIARGITANEKADADNVFGTDDEDGIVAVNGIPYTGGVINLIENQKNTMTIRIANAPTAGAYAVIWLDGKDGRINYQFDNNNDGQILEKNSTGNKISNGEMTFEFDLDKLGNRTETQGMTYMRMRVSTEPITGNGGTQIDGEVEDHQVFISEQKTDYGDLPDTYKTTLSADGARHLDIFLFGKDTPLGGFLKIGANKDYEVDANAPLNGTGDDVTGISDDEDGVRFFSGTSETVGTTIYADSTNTMKVTTTGSGTLAVFVDKNGNKSFEDADERIYFNAISGTGTETTIIIPAGIAIPSDGKVGVRVRFASDANQVAKSFGEAYGGEIEDYYVPITQASLSVNKSVVAGTPDTPNPRIDYAAGKVYVKYDIEIRNLNPVPVSGYTVEEKVTESDYSTMAVLKPISVKGMGGTTASYDLVTGITTISEINFIGVESTTKTIEAEYSLSDFAATNTTLYDRATVKNAEGIEKATDIAFVEVVILQSATVLKSVGEVSYNTGQTEATVTYTFKVTNGT
ncbi:MAG: GEVED domain-containing protein, partial [Fusobacteriaceae bacterium]